MTLAAACGWSLVRSLVVALVAWPFCRRAAEWLRGIDPRRRRWAWGVLLVPFLCPELWTGYAWTGFGLRLASWNFWELIPGAFFPASPHWVVARDAAVDELLLDLLLLFRAVPVGALVVYFAPPPPLSNEALYCRQLASGKWRWLQIFSVPPLWGRAGVGGRTPIDALHPHPNLPPSRGKESISAPRDLNSGDTYAQGERGNVGRQTALLTQLKFVLFGPLYTALPAICLMFLVTFQEFELASLIGRPAWTVWLFDAQVGGLALAESLRLAVVPVACQLAVLAPLAWVVLTNRTSRTTTSTTPRQISKGSHVTMACLLSAGVIMACVIPILLVGRGTLEGLVRVWQNSTQLHMLLREILFGMGYALTGATIAVLVADRLSQSARGSRPALAGIVVGFLPGFVGSLVLSLVLIRVLQLPLARFAYKSSFSFALGLVLFLLPRALLLRVLLHSASRSAGYYVATLLRDSPAASVREQARRLTWQLRWSGEFWGLVLLAYWGFLELTIANLLAPVTIVSAPVMLYNQMHFGKNAILSALVFLTVFVPALLFAAVALARSFFFRLIRR